MRISLRLSAVVFVGLAVWVGIVAAAEKSTAPSDAALARTLKTVRMLDDVYKSAIILITDKYVNSKDDFPAGSAAVEWFKHISDNKWHEVRLLDATGSPTVDTNVARDEFERAGIKSLKAGQSFVQKVEVRNGKNYLRAMTPVPVVLKKCVMCHPHYAHVKNGEPIGAVSYTLAIE
jgi:hypothetical protein